MTKIEKIKKIKEYENPPWDKNDIYWLREPWNKFGGVSSGICMMWYWYRDEIVDIKTTDEDVDMAYNEIIKLTF